MKRIHFLVILVMIVFYSSQAFTRENAPKRLTVEWLNDVRVQEKFRPPRYTWLNNGMILLLDYQKPWENRNLEILDPKTNERTEAFQRNKILSALIKEAGGEAPSSIRWPDAIDPNGRALVYIIDGDIYCVEFYESSLKRLTKTAASESAVAFSPDGKWISFIRANDIYAINWREGTFKRLTSGATDTLLNGVLSWVYWEEVYYHTPLPYSWSPDSRAIAYLQSNDSMVSLSTFVNFKPATQEVVRQHYPKAGQANPEVRLGIVDIFSQKTTWVNCGKYEYLARFKWLPAGDEIAVQTLNRSQSELNLFIADRESGSSQKILTEKQPAWIDLNDSPYFLKDGKRFIWLSERDGYQHLYLFHRNGQLIRQLTKGEFMVLSSEGALLSGNSGLAGVDDQSWVYFSSNRHALRERHLYRVKLDGTGLMRLTDKAGVHSVRFSPGGEYFLDTFSNSSTPPSLILCQADGKTLRVVVPSAKEDLQGLDVVFAEFQSFPTEDGLELPAMIIRPANFSAQRKYPAIVYVYGGPGSQQVVNRWSSRGLWHSLLAQEGFFVFVFEVRAGMGKSTALETSVFRRAYGMQNVKDILAGVRWLQTMPFIDQDRIGIWGWSGGGCTTLYTMTHCNAFKAGIAVAPVSDWDFYDTIYTERYQGTPQDNPEGYKETSSVLAASNLKGRLLIVHGTYDDNVHPQNTYAFINELIKHNIPFELMIYPWRKHGISDPPARVHLYTLMLDFWRRNLKGDHSKR